jgi:tRNA modification GTPase
MQSPSVNDETICAVSTPPGQGGIGVIRISGRESFEIGGRIFRSSQKKTRLQTAPTHTLHHGKIVDPKTGEVLDEVIASIMRSPRSYTGEDVLELSCHGNSRSLRKIIALLIREGAREALPGEFTRRAFLNGRIDLVQAEAVMDFISAESERARRLALKHLNGEFSKVISSLREEGVGILSKMEASIDFSQEDIEIISHSRAEASIRELLQKIDDLLKTARDGRIAREGVRISLAGKPNVGKSSLLNALLERERAIVTSIAGTTRDTLEESLILHGIKIRLVDTAGIRPTEDEIEKEGIRRTEETLEQADLILWMIDAEIGLTPEDDKEIEKFSGKNYLILVNKIDLVREFSGLKSGKYPEERILKISSLRKTGIRELQEKMAHECAVLAGENDSEEGAVILRGRHEEALKEARGALERAIESLQKGMSYEFPALDLRGAIDHLGEILGITAPDEVLHQIFKDFCIGK